MTYKVIITTAFFLLILISCSDSPSYKIGEFSDSTKHIKFKYPDTSIINRLNRQIDTIKDKTLKYTLIDSLRKADSKTNPNACNVIPDAKTASKIAFIYLCNIFGKDNIKDELPLIVYQYEDYWLIIGTFNHMFANGGVAEIGIRKSDGLILYYSHGK